MFPDDGKAKGVRAPGSWNPATDAPNAIFNENTAELIKTLRRPIGKVRGGSEERFPNTENNIYGEAAFLYPAWQKHWRDRFGITKPSMRHTQLLASTGEVFHQVGATVAQKLVEAQHCEATVKMQTSLRDHLNEFKKMWAALAKSWKSTLTTREVEAYSALHSDNERDGFRIVRSFDMKARAGGSRRHTTGRWNSWFICRMNKRIRVLPRSRVPFGKGRNNPECRHALARTRARTRNLSPVL